MERALFVESIHHYPLVGDSIRACCEDKSECEYCDCDTAASQCSRCHTVKYCSKQCQTNDWKAGHELECKAIQYNVPWHTYTKELAGTPELSSVPTRHLARFIATEKDAQLENIGASAKFKYVAKKKITVSKNERSAANFSTMMMRRAFLQVKLIKNIVTGTQFERNQTINALKLNSKIFTARFGVPNVNIVQGILQQSDNVLESALSGDTKVLFNEIPKSWASYWIEWSINKSKDAKDQYTTQMSKYFRKLLDAGFVLKKNNNAADEAFYAEALEVIKLAKMVGDGLDKGPARSA